MRCAEYRDLVAAHVDGVLGADDAAGVHTHVAACADCARVYAQAAQFRWAFHAPVRTTPAAGNG